MTKDRYRYFRVEARELLDALSRGVLELERSPGDRRLVAGLLRHAHTLKGAARVVQQRGIGDLAHEAEDVLGPHREEGAPPVPPERIDALLRILDAISAGVTALDPAPPPRPEGAPAEERAAADGFRSVRVDVAELDALLASVLEAGVQVTTLRRQLGALDHAEEAARALSEQLAGPRPGAEAAATPARARALAEELRRSLREARRALTTRADHAEGELGEVRTAADRLRLLPARAVFGTLERGARDAARALDRAVTFEGAGGEVRVDAAVLSAVRDALLHVVRNAVAHGIEPAEERLRAGKPALGTVRVLVERRGRRVVFSCRDDGRGVDEERVRSEAVRRGLHPGDGAGGALEGEALAALLLRGGLSTSRTVTPVAGRGVGLDVVRDTAARLDAQVSLRSEPGRGTTVEIAVPMSVTALTALHVEVGGTSVAVPLDAVRRTAFVEPTRLAALAQGTGLEHDGAVIPFAPLAAVLRLPPAAGPRRFWSTLVVQAGAQLVALGADRLAGTSEVVVRPLARHVEADPVVAGAALDAEGNPQLVLDPAGLVAALAEVTPPPDRAPVARAPLLVVDDSLTTRMLEQSILESAGYEVEVASSAEEALERARARRFGVFLVDVEMPGMDGFEFVRVTRADPRTAETPAILVTSRGGAEDLRRGVEAGASAHIVKSEFDQGRLLATIEELLRS